MHYAIVIVTEEFPTDEVLEKVLEPYEDEVFYGQFGEDEDIPDTAERPVFTWDWWQVGGRYCGRIKLKIDYEDEEYEWKFYTKKPRAGRLFRSMMLEKIDKLKASKFFYAEDEIRPYLGSIDGYIRVDGCKAKDAIDLVDNVVENSWGFIGKDGKAYGNEYWNGKKYEKNEQYEKEVREAMKGISDEYVCYVDIHD